MMNKHIRSIFLLNKSEAFAVIKPLNNSISHDNILLSKKFSTSQTGGCLLHNGLFLQNETGPPIKDGPLLIVFMAVYYRWFGMIPELPIVMLACTRIGASSIASSVTGSSGSWAG